jgi:type VI secretion system protein ImpK
MPDDPFAGLGLDRTIIMPAPGGRAAPARPAVVDQREQVEVVQVTSGLNALVAAANPLLNVIPQIAGSMEYPKPAALRETLARGVRDFEARARSAGATTETIVAARYALCTLIDETAARTPWGASGAWAQHGLLAMFHRETEGGEKFFQILARLAENPRANLDVIELMYVCLQLGLEGRYRVLDGGHRQLDAVRQRVLSIIRQQRGEYERDLSPSWKGVLTANQRHLGWLPLWVAAAVTALLLVGIYSGFRLSLTSSSDAIAAKIASLRIPASPSRPTPVPKRPEEPRLAPFLVEEIRQGRVAVDDRRDRSVVTVLGDGLFKPGDGAINTRDDALFGRIGDALAQVPGKIDVIGHTDNAPIRTLRFPSNWELSKSRAESVASILASRVPRARIEANGRGETEPVSSNDTAEGRARNRRVEIVLHVPAEGVPDGTSGSPPRKP